MAEVKFTALARQDLFDILQYLGDTAGLLTARKYNAKFEDLSRRLSAHPGIGSPREALGPETRAVAVPPYEVVYDGGPKGDVVYILRILHGRMDITPDLIAQGREP